MIDFFSKNHKRYLLLLALFIISFLFRLWLVDKRWINPDEGAHLMDALLVLSGKIPTVDFGSRQPLYVYAIAGVLKLFGPDYISGRLLPISCSLLTGILMFLMARALFDEKVAVLSAAIYWMLPLELFNSPIVKTEPLVIFLTCLSLYTLIRFSQHKQKPWLIVSGVFAAMGFYVRQSALIIPLMVLVFLILFHGWRGRAIAKSIGLFLAGYISFFSIVLVFYSRFMTPNDLLISELSPFGFLVWAGKKLLIPLGLMSTASHVSPSQFATVSSNTSYYWYYNYIRDAFYLHSFLIIGSLFSLVSLGRRFLICDRKNLWENLPSHSLLYFWVLFLFIAYALFFQMRGFFIDYFREFLPPLVIIFSAWLRHSVPALEREGHVERVIVAGLCLSAFLFLLQSNFKPLFFGVGFQASLAIALIAFLSFVWALESPTRRFFFLSTFLAIIAFILISHLTPFKLYFSGILPKLGMIFMIYALTWAFLEKPIRLQFLSYAKFVRNSTVLACFAASIGFSAFLLDLTYDSVWSPESLQKTAQYLKAHTSADDDVMSGAVIWEFQALRKPFGMISHPLAFLEINISKEIKEKLARSVVLNPPKVIILDGYTQKTYIRQLPWLPEFIQSKYSFVTTLGPARYPIRIYQLEENMTRDSAT